MTQSDLKSLLFTVLCRALALDENAPASSALVVPAYEPEPGPARPASDDVVYFYLAPEDAETSRFQTLTYEDRFPAVSSFLSFRLVLIVYGPRAFDLLSAIRRNLFLDGWNLPLSLLRKHDLYVFPDPPIPALTWEESGNRWRKRADLSVSLRLADRSVYQSPQAMLAAAPAVLLHRP